MTTFSASLVTSILDGSATVRTDTTAGTGTIVEEFWVKTTIAAGASDVNLKLNFLTDPDILIVLGATGISIKLDSTGTDSIGADPMAVISDADAGLGIDEILISNSDSVEHSVTIISFET